jgi:hypothetical protein
MRGGREMAVRPQDDAQHRDVIGCPQESREHDCRAGQDGAPVLRLKASKAPPANADDGEPYEAGLWFDREADGRQHPEQPGEPRRRGLSPQPADGQGEPRQGGENL